MLLLVEDISIPVYYGGESSYKIIAVRTQNNADCIIHLSHYEP